MKPENYFLRGLFENDPNKKIELYSKTIDYLGLDHDAFLLVSYYFQNE